MLQSIPSPHSGTLSIGPLTLHMYGLMLLAGIAACIWLTGRRWVARGGDWDLIFRVAVWGVAFGIVGARAYHVATSWNEVDHKDWWGVFAVWHGGLGVWGNWWNQELYGKPTKLAWGLKIDIEHQGSIAPKYRNAAAYHPTFLYEFVYDTIMAGGLV